MSIKIVTDSSVTIEPEVAQALNITIIPISVMIDGVVYKDTELPFDEFLKKMGESKNLPKTSQPPVGVFAEVYDELAADGSEIISIHIAASLSGTAEAARQGSMLSQASVTVLDSNFTDQAQKFQVVEAARLAQAGASKEEILAAVEYIKENTELYLGISTLENLTKGGRISRMSGILGGLLNMRVIAEMRDQKLEIMTKGRGNKAFQKWLDEFADKLSTSGRKVKEIGVSHAANLEFSNTIKNNLQKFVEKPISVMDTNSTIATHTGVGAWAILVNYE